MAKNNEKSGIISINDVNDENVKEALQNANTFKKEIVEKAKKDKEEKEAERMAREFNEISDQATYFNLRMALDARTHKKIAKVYADTRDESKKLLERVEKGELTAIQFQKEQKEMVKEQIKAVDKLKDELREDRDELRTKFPSGNWWEWDSCFNELSAAIKRINEQR